MSIIKFPQKPPEYEGVTVIYLDTSWKARVIAWIARWFR